MIERPFRGGPASTSDDLMLALHRKPYMEETHFRVAYSPVADPSVDQTGVGGVLATVTETTEQVYGQRQLGTLRELGARNAAESKTAEQACAASAATLATNAWDVPFALFYLLDSDGRRASLAASCGVDPAKQSLLAPEGQDLATDAIAGPWPIRGVVDERRTVVIEDLSRCADSLPVSPWAQRPRSAIALPLASPDQPHPYGVLICGISPHRQLDLGYRTFFELAAAQIVTAIRNARAYQAERRRAEQLAELDRAKTAFFSNVSHEFRTPLTLMLGPTEDALASGRGLSGDELRGVYRNEVRLLKLVNALLDFSRMEAGRAQACFEGVDLAALTADLASSFHSAIERAQLNFSVDCQSLPEPFYVDRVLWEKVVLNLLSNAMKFTFSGSIAVELHPNSEGAELKVRDTGTGVPAHELPRMFERFHRIEGQKGRTHEGSGIGLALVAEIVKMHGGSVSVTSTAGTGSTFTVRLRRGKEHLPEARIGKPSELARTSSGAGPYVQEALQWLPGIGGAVGPVRSLPASAAQADGTRGARVLLAEDNGDMRAYVGRLLGERWQVMTAANGAEALESARREKPDLILSDVMMPVLDGFELLREVRRDPSLKSIPVILLSARAGEDARVDGLQTGADDYLVKPFSAVELMARVSTHLLLARSRAALEAERAGLLSVFAQAPVGIAVLHGQEPVYELANEPHCLLAGRPRKELIGRSLREAHPELEGSGVFEMYDLVFSTGEPYRAADYSRVSSRPRFGENGTPTGSSR